MQRGVWRRDQIWHRGTWAHSHVPLGPFHTSHWGKPHASSIHVRTEHSQQWEGHRKGKRREADAAGEADTSLEHFPGWQVPSAPVAAFNPKAPCLQEGILPGLGRWRSEGAEVLGFSLSLGGGKALYNLLKQEHCSLNALWLTEMNPKTSFN